MVQKAIDSPEIQYLTPLKTWWLLFVLVVSNSTKDLKCGPDATVITVTW